MKNKSLLLFCGVIIGLLFACNLSNSVTQYDYSYLYDKNQTVISPSYKVFHHHADTSTLFYEISSEDILYERLKGDSSLVARIKLKYAVYSDIELKTIIDSARMQVYNFGSNANPTTIQNQFTFGAPLGGIYWLVIQFRDDNKDLNIINVLKVDKRENKNHQYFMAKQGEKVLMNAISPNKQVSLVKSPLIKDEAFIMESSNQQFAMTPPPFIRMKTNQLNISFDSSYTFTFENHSFQASHLKAFNRFRAKSDTTETSNFVFHFTENFPTLSTIEELLEPTRYISTSKEYNAIKTAVYPKKALDEFWLKLGKNEEKAKAMIQEYYTRLEIANRYFSSYKEGWKTDRGIIYMIYGTPTTIKKDAESETWTYGEADNILSVQFSFYKNENNISENDFVLVRNVEYKNNWYRAVDLWRQGKVY